MAGKLTKILRFLKIQIFKPKSGIKQETSDRELFRYLFLRQETEKVRISEELKECLSLLSTHRFLLNDTEKTEFDSKDLQSIEKSLNSIRDKIKSITLTLQPPFLQQKFTDTIETLCRQFCNEHNNINMRSRIEDIKEEDIPDHLRIVVCKVLQKVMKRSHMCFDSNNINITLRNSKDSLDLIFEDDAMRESLDKQKSEDLKLQIESLARLSNGTIKRTTIYPEGRMITFSWNLQQEG